MHFLSEKDDNINVKLFMNMNNLKKSDWPNLMYFSFKDCDRIV